MTDSLGPVWVIGPGRIGRALGHQLERRGISEALAYIARVPADPPTPQTFSWDNLPDSVPKLVLIAVRDDFIPAVAEKLDALGLPPSVVLHTSGVLSSDALQPLGEGGWEIGSMPPVASIADPVKDADRLIGAWFAVEGSAGAVEVAKRIAEALDGRALELRSKAKVAYHAAAVFASNYLVTLMNSAERLMTEAGVDPDDARAVLSQLAMGALENSTERGPVEALTGPVSRGDAETIRRHLARLSPDTARLYSVLAEATLEIARERGLDPVASAAVAKVLAEVGT